MTAIGSVSIALPGAGAPTEKAIPVKGSAVTRAAVVDQATAQFRQLALESNSTNAFLAQFRRTIQQKSGLLSPIVDLIQGYSFPVLTGEQAYNEVTSRSQPERDIIEGRAFGISSVSDAYVNSVVGDLEKAGWNAASPLFKNQNFHVVALKALKLGKITDQQFASFSLFAAAHRAVLYKKQQDKYFERSNTAKMPALVSVPLFDVRGQPTEDAKAIITNSVKSTNCHVSGTYDDAYAFLNEEQIALFFKLMGQLPTSEQQFLLMPNAYKDRDYENQDRNNIVNIIRLVRAIRVFSLFKANDLQGIPVLNQFFASQGRGIMVSLQIIPSAGMMQCFLNAMCGENAVRMNFVLGVSRLRDVRQNGLDGTRDVGIPFAPLVPLPKLADTQQATELDYNFHDFYHCFVASWIPQGHRELFIDALDMMRFHNLNKSAAKGYGTMCYLLRDMEHILYLPHRFNGIIYNHLFPKQSPMTFWATLGYIMANSQLSLEHKKVVAMLFVERYAVKEVGKSRGVTAKDLLELAQLLRSEIAIKTRELESLKNKDRYQHQQCESGLEELRNSGVFQMEQLYISLTA